MPRPRRKEDDRRIEDEKTPEPCEVAMDMLRIVKSRSSASGWASMFSSTSSGPARGLPWSSAVVEIRVAGVQRSASEAIAFSLLAAAAAAATSAAARRPGRPDFAAGLPQPLPLSLPRLKMPGPPSATAPPPTPPRTPQGSAARKREAQWRLAPDKHVSGRDLRHSRGVPTSQPSRAQERSDLRLEECADRCCSGIRQRPSACHGNVSSNSLLCPCESAVRGRQPPGTRSKREG
mmetsp:Transcript_40527/g.101818  ORF Transcript_40527/g.101818 Transcript_40527/m.101818 type:complete len:234 (+) Transcript_40527:1169-1870(+)